MGITDYAEIVTQEHMDELLDRMSSFHDSLAKEMHIVNRGFVDADATMMMSHRFDARLLVQSQWALRAIEMLFVDVVSFANGDAAEYWGASGTISFKTVPTDQRLVHMSFDSRLTVSARRLFVRDRVDAYGARTRFGEEIPHPSVVPATTLIDGWRLCSRCADGFEAHATTVYALCPTCGAMTEFVRE